MDTVSNVGNEIQEWQDILGPGDTSLSWPWIVIGLILIALFVAYWIRERRR